MRADLAVPFADATAAGLRWELVWAARPRPALRVHAVALGPALLELRVLGASHQVVGPTFTETVACLPGPAAVLPSSTVCTSAGARYEFAATAYSGPDFAARVAGVRDAAAADPAGLVGVFPGSPLAVTALRADAVPGGVRWRSWHAYPQRGEIVTTTSMVTYR
jgi:hypothetical protein